MKSIKISSILIMFLGFALSSFSQADVISEVLQQDEFAFKITNESDVQLIDVRTPEEFLEGYIEGAENININDADFVRRVGELDKNRPVYVYCRSGGRSAKAAERLNTMGFSEVYDLEGGYMDWIKR